MAQFTTGGVTIFRSASTTAELGELIAGQGISAGDQAILEAALAKELEGDPELATALDGYRGAWGSQREAFARLLGMLLSDEKRAGYLAEVLRAGGGTRLFRTTGEVRDEARRALGIIVPPKGGGLLTEGPRLYATGPESGLAPEGYGSMCDGVAGYLHAAGSDGNVTGFWAGVRGMLQRISPSSVTQFTNPLAVVFHSSTAPEVEIVNDEIEDERPDETFVRRIIAKVIDDRRFMYFLEVRISFSSGGFGVHAFIWDMGSLDGGRYGEVTEGRMIGISRWKREGVTPYSEIEGGMTRDRLRRMPPKDAIRSVTPFMGDFESPNEGLGDGDMVR